MLPDALRARGAEVDVLAPLRDRGRAARPSGRSPPLAGADYITFTSSSTVRFFLAAAGGRPASRPPRGWSRSDPVTSATLREHGLEPDVEAERHDIDGADRGAARRCGSDRPRPRERAAPLDQLPVRLRARRRVRRRLPRRDRAPLPAGAGHRPRPRDPPPRRARRRARRSPPPLRFLPAGVHARRRRPGRRRASAARWRCAACGRSACSSAPTTAC